MEFIITATAVVGLIIYLHRKPLHTEPDTRITTYKKVVKIPMITFTTENKTTQTDDPPPSSPMSSISSLDFHVFENYLEDNSPLN